tara:strand:- start:3309 stop:3500 length:192 start_codon:yes stop_codon:yes gene_type:complete
MDVSKWKSVAVRKETSDNFKKICKLERRSPSDQLAIFIEDYERKHNLDLSKLKIEKIKKSRAA